MVRGTTPPETSTTGTDTSTTTTKTGTSITGAGTSTPGAGTSTPGAGTSTPGAGTSTTGAGTSTTGAGTSTTRGAAKNNTPQVTAGSSNPQNTTNNPTPESTEGISTEESKQEEIITKLQDIGFENMINGTNGDKPCLDEANRTALAGALGLAVTGVTQTTAALVSYFTANPPLVEAIKEEFDLDGTKILNFVNEACVASTTNNPVGNNQESGSTDNDYTAAILFSLVATAGLIDLTVNATKGTSPIGKVSSWIGDRFNAITGRVPQELPSVKNLWNYVYRSCGWQETNTSNDPGPGDRTMQMLRNPMFQEDATNNDGPLYYDNHIYDEISENDDYEVPVPNPNYDRGSGEKTVPMNNNLNYEIASNAGTTRQEPNYDTASDTAERRLDADGYVVEEDNDYIKFNTEETYDENTLPSTKLEADKVSRVSQTQKNNSRTA